MSKPGILAGAGIGALLSAPLTALIFLGDRLAGLPLVHFDVLDWMARSLPGGVIRAMIRGMVTVLELLGLSVRDTAKTAEQVMAVAGLMLTAALAGAVLFGAARAVWRRSGVLAGLIAGLVFGLPVLLISLSVNQTASAGPVVSAVWVLGVFLGWGAAAGWAYNRLSGAPALSAEGVPSVEVLDRRRFLIRMGTSVAAITVVGGGLAAALTPRGRSEEAAAAPDAPDAAANAAALPTQPVVLPDREGALEPAPGTRPEVTPIEEHYRIDISARPPQIDGATWRLKISGMVDNPLELSLNDLATRYEPVSRFVTLSCISNFIGGELISTTQWTGARLQDVLAEASVQPGAQYLTILSRDGFHESLSLRLVEEDPRIMLAYLWDGQPLTERNGYPLRIYIPDRYGMKQPKWITEIVVTDTEEPGYWVVRRWDAVARVQTTSVIDTIAVDAAYEQDGATYIPIGGIAYAGARGISKVEISVDGGEWVAAELREPLSDTTWVIWRYDWPFSAGEHTFTVRCVEGDGTPQIERHADIFPSGATGLHDIRREV